MSFLKSLFGSKPSNSAKGDEQTVLIYLDGSTLPDEVYQQHDLATIEDRLVAALANTGLGEFDGNEIGGGETKLYLYGPDAERLFAHLEPILTAYPLCRNARVVIRRGRPGAPQREVQLPKA